MAARKADPPAVSRRLFLGVLVAFAAVTVAVQFGVSWPETEAFEALVGRGGWWQDLLVWVQPAGTLFAVAFATLLVAIYNRDHAVRMSLSGSVAWLAATVAKAVVGRPRPDALLGTQPDQVAQAVSDTAGYPSVHVATIVALVVALWPELYRGERLVGVALALLVALGRIELGVHLPLDIVGGALLGTLVALSVQALLAGSRS